ncbi:hypothetical protein [Blautia producta]|uniref:hypothetical protein n=1 Tax=Blautia producta TaxID=33035 RepID=UPI00356B20AD
MINKSAEYFESIAKQLGVSIKIPRPSKTMKNVSALTNGLIGIGFITSGILYRKLSLTMFGSLGIVGAILLVLDE